MPTAKTVKPASGRDSPGVAAGLALTMMPWSLATHAATTWLEGVTRMNGEWARFVADRLRHDAETQHEIFSCGSPVEAQRLGTAFLRRTVEDYATEAQRIYAMGAHVADQVEHVGREGTK